MRARVAVLLSCAALAPHATPERARVSSDFSLLPEIEAAGFSIAPANSTQHVRWQLRRSRRGQTFGLLQNKLLGGALLRALGLPHVPVVYGAFCTHPLGPWPQYSPTALHLAVQAFARAHPIGALVIQPLTDGGGAGAHVVREPLGMSVAELKRIAKSICPRHCRLWSARGLPFEHRGILVRPLLGGRVRPAPPPRTAAAGARAAARSEGGRPFELSVHVSLDGAGQRILGSGVATSAESAPERSGSGGSSGGSGGGNSSGSSRGRRRRPRGSVFVSFCERAAVRCEHVPSSRGGWWQAEACAAIRPALERLRPRLHALARTLGDAYGADWFGLRVLVLGARSDGQPPELLVSEVAYPSRLPDAAPPAPAAEAPAAADPACAVRGLEAAYRQRGRALRFVAGADVVAELLGRIGVRPDEFVARAELLAGRMDAASEREYEQSGWALPPPPTLPAEKRDAAGGARGYCGADASSSPARRHGSVPPAPGAPQVISSLRAAELLATIERAHGPDLAPRAGGAGARVELLKQLRFDGVSVGYVYALGGRVLLKQSFRPRAAANGTASRAARAHFSSLRNEAVFHRRHAARLAAPPASVPMPRPLLVLDTAAEGLLLCTELVHGAALRAQAWADAHVRVALRALARLHGSTWGITPEQLGGLSARGGWFNLGNWLARHDLRRLRAQAEPPWARLALAARALEAWLNASPWLCLIHGDLHPRNLLFSRAPEPGASGRRLGSPGPSSARAPLHRLRAAGRAAGRALSSARAQPSVQLIDFENAGRGPPAKDVASLFAWLGRDAAAMHTWVSEYHGALSAVLGARGMTAPPLGALLLTVEVALADHARHFRDGGRFPAQSTFKKAHVLAVLQAVENGTTPSDEAAYARALFALRPPGSDAPLLKYE